MSLSLSGPIILIGAGNMGGAMAAGWVKSGIAGSQIIAADPNPPEAMRARLGASGIQFAAGAPEGVTASVIFVAVKPQVMDKVLPSYRPLIGNDTIVVSIAAGKTLAFLEEHLGQAPMVRAMPSCNVMSASQAKTSMRGNSGTERSARTKQTM